MLCCALKMEDISGLARKVLDSGPEARHNETYNHVVPERRKVARRSEDPKVAALREERSLNPRPEAVRDPAFAGSEFLDARDMVQVKYEMVRRVRVEGEAVSRSAAESGFSRPSYYQAASAIDAGGLAALVPARPGPLPGAQDVGRRRGLRTRAVGSRPSPASSRPGRADRGALWSPGAPALGGTGARSGGPAQKWRPVMSVPATGATWSTTSSFGPTPWRVSRRAGASAWRCCKGGGRQPGSGPVGASPCRSSARRLACRPAGTRSSACLPPWPSLPRVGDQR